MNECRENLPTSSRSTSRAAKVWATPRLNAVNSEDSLTIVTVSLKMEQVTTACDAPAGV